MGEALGADLARHVGDGLNNLSASLLEHQRTSARDRQALRDAMDNHYEKLDEKIDQKFDAVEVRLKNVCDKGGQEHDAMRARLTELERELAEARAQSRGRGQMLAGIAASVTWAMEHGWKLLLVLYMGWQIGAPIIERNFQLAPMAQVRIP